MKSLFSILVLFVALSATAQDIRLSHLQCEGKSMPMGVDAATPSFSWEIQATQRRFVQSAYRVQLTTDTTQAGKTWDSRKTTSDQSFGVQFKGNILMPAQTYYWRVTVWDNKGKQSAWSNYASFTTGLLTTNDWSGAKWIGYENMHDTAVIVPGVHSPDIKKKLGATKGTQRTVVPLFRKAFVAKMKPVEALVFVSGLGQYELSFNGVTVGNSSLAPGWTFYDKRCLYNTYDVTGLISNGENVVGAMVGNGFFNVNRERYIKLAIAFGMPQLICKLQLKYDDGSTDVIVSGNDWKTAPSPVTFSSIYGGEDYDARLEQQGWNNPGFNDGQWKQALLVKAPKGKLESEKDYPVAVMETIRVKNILQPVGGSYVYDFGQNASGIVELVVKGKRGQTVRLIPAELLNNQQLANQNNTGKPFYFTYTMKGDGEEVWRPKFTYYGFRYVQVDSVAGENGNSDLPVITRMDMLHTRNSSPGNGTFTSSSALFNKINDLINWAIKSNVQSVITDCPHREKLSWLEQDYLMWPSIQRNMEVYNLSCKLVDDMIDAQTPEGLVPDIAPEYVFFDDNGFGFRDSPEWGSAAVIMPWMLYKRYGDMGVVRKAYPMMKKYVAYLEKKSDSHILSYGLGDWYDLGPQRPGVAQLTPKALTATAVYYYDLMLLARMASLTGQQTDAKQYTNQAGAVKQAFNKKFFDAAVKLYGTGSQTSMAMPLALGLVDESNRPAVTKNLVDSIYANGKKLTSGDIGYHFLLRALFEGGASQLIYDMNSRDDVPGYGYQLKKGATALTESWQALEAVSNNHLMLGHLMEWFYGGLAGINQAENSVGFKVVTIDPQVVGDINSVRATYRSPYGVIVSDWKKEAGRFTLNIEIPANSSAIVYLPATTPGTIKESNKTIVNRNDIRAGAVENGKMKLVVGSGKYEFVVE
jgi:alpha-L-rhamnosidase